MGPPRADGPLAERRRAQRAVVDCQHEQRHSRDRSRIGLRSLPVRGVSGWSEPTVTPGCGVITPAVSSPPRDYSRSYSRSGTSLPGTSLPAPSLAVTYALGCVGSRSCMAGTGPDYLHPEQKARQRIDAMLETAGWVVQDYRSVNLFAGTGVAVRELVTQAGPADYVLFVEGQAVGVIEAKKQGTPLAG